MTAMQDVVCSQAPNIDLDADMQMTKEIDVMVGELCAKWTDVGVDGQRLGEGFGHKGSDSLGLAESISGCASTCSPILSRPVSRLFTLLEHGFG